MDIDEEIATTRQCIQALHDAIRDDDILSRRAMIDTLEHMEWLLREVLKAQTLPEVMEELANRVAAKEREACAWVCDQMHIGISHDRRDWHTAIASCANEIRARGEA